MNKRIKNKLNARFADPNFVGYGCGVFSQTTQGLSRIYNQCAKYGKKWQDGEKMRKRQSRIPTLNKPPF